MRAMKRGFQILVLAMVSSLLLPSVGYADKGKGKGPGKSAGAEAKGKEHGKKPKADKEAKGLKKDKGEKPDKKLGPHGPGKGPRAGKGPHGLALGKGHPKGEGMALGKDKPEAEGAGGETAAEPTEEELAKRAAMREQRRKRIKARRLALSKNMHHRKAFKSGEGRMGKLAVERRKHLRRMARIRRLAKVAAEKGDAQLIERIEKLQEKEQKRHEKFTMAARPKKDSTRSLP